MEKERWGSKLGVILAVTGSAVGLGNFLRFPGVAWRQWRRSIHDPLYHCLPIVGLPIAWVEWAMADMAEKGFSSAPGIFRAITGKDSSAQIGTLALIIPVIIYMWYVSIEAWCLGYAFKYWSMGMQSIVSAAQQAVPADGKIDAGIQAVQNYLLYFAGVIPENDSIKKRQFSYYAPIHTRLTSIFTLLLHH